MDRLLNSFQKFLLEDQESQDIIGGQGGNCVTGGYNFDSDGCSSSWSDTTSGGTNTTIDHRTDNNGGDWE